MGGIVFANLSASAAVLLILLLRRFFKEKLFAKFFVMLWLLAIIRLLLPFEFFSPISIYSPLSEPEESFSEKEYIGFEDFSVGEKVPTEKTEASFVPKAEKIKISSEEALVFIWASGGISVGGFFAAKHLHTVKRILKNSKPYDVPEIYKTGNTRFYKSKNLASPLSFGILRPVIVIPEETPEDQLHFVLLHEQTHIKDRDAVLKILALFALSLNRFNPLVWFMVKIFERDIERYCDERVLEKTGAEKALFYANTILDFAERESLSLNYFSAASLCERVTSIMKTKHKKQNLFVSVLVLAAVILTITACGTMPEEKTEKEPVKTEKLSQILDETEKEKGKGKELISLNGESETTTEIPGLPEDMMGYIYTEGEPPPNNYVIETFGFPDYMEIEKIVVKGFSFSEEASVNVICIPAGETEISVGYGDELRGAGFAVSAENGTAVLIATAEEITDVSESFDLRIYADFEKVSVEIENLDYLIYEGEEPDIETESHIYSYYNPETEIDFVWPTEKGYIACQMYSYKGHTGIDIAGENGSKSEIFAAADGTVVKVKRSNKGYGYHMIIDHGNGVQTLYAHCSDMYVKLGQKVKAGEPIGKIGSTGNSTGIHLHFEIRINGQYVDPEKYLPTLETN